MLSLNWTPRGNAIPLAASPYVEVPPHESHITSSLQSSLWHSCIALSQASNFRTSTQPNRPKKLQNQNQAGDQLKYGCPLLYLWPQLGCCCSREGSPLPDAASSTRCPCGQAPGKQSPHLPCHLRAGASGFQSSRFWTSHFSDQAWVQLTAGCGSWQTQEISVVCEPLPPSWAPWLVGWAERECGNGCLESRGSRDCCNRFCLQTLAAHLKFADRGRQAQDKQSGYTTVSPLTACLYGVDLPGPEAHPQLLGQTISRGGDGCTFFYFSLK